MMVELRRSPIRDCILNSLEYFVSQIVWVVCLDTLVGSELQWGWLCVDVVGMGEGSELGRGVGNGGICY